MNALGDVLPKARDDERMCERHGRYIEIPLYRGSRPLGCPTCGAERNRALAAEHAKAEEMRHHRQLREAGWGQSNLIGRFREASFETFDAKTPAQRKVLEACREFAAAPCGNLWLIGSVGTGKTHLAAAIVRHILDNSDPPAWATLRSAREIVRELRATWARGAEESEERVIERFARVGVLAIDELGVGSGTEAETTQLYDVIDRRYQLERPSVLVSNLSLPMLQEQLGDRIFDRLRENAKVLTCSWPSCRSTR